MYDYISNSYIVGIVNCLKLSRSMLDRFGMSKLFQWGIVLGRNE